MIATQAPMVSMQHKLQHAVLRASEANPGIEGRRVAVVCDADQRDVERAVELLVRAGAIEGDPAGATRAQAIPPMWLTDEGRRRLREEPPVIPSPRHEIPARNSDMAGVGQAVDAAGSSPAMNRVSFILPPASRSAPQARERLRTLLGSWADEDTRSDAQLLLTEVVANAVNHARSPMTIQLTVAHDLLRAEVADDSPHAPRRRDADESGGRGVLILNALASRWGVVGHACGGKTVWFELTTTAQ